MNTYIPNGYQSKLSIYDTQRAIVLLRNTFEKELASALNLLRVSAPLFVSVQSGMNDNLSGIERAVEFDIPATNCNAQVVHSLAKWKRQALYDYNFRQGKGLYTNMNAIRRDEELDNIHSIYVDQWDWEAILLPNTRNLDTLKEHVKKIVKAVSKTAAILNLAYPELDTTIEENVYFITTQELLDMYPNLNAKQRENEITKKYKTVCLMQIGDKLSNGLKHDERAADYDDWKLNCDILLWNDVLESALEISSMGIRVDADALVYQLQQKNETEKLMYQFHKSIINNTLPLTIGGGIGQSRLSMILLKKVHIGEVQSSLWDANTLKICSKNNVILL